MSFITYYLRRIWNWFEFTPQQTDLNSLIRSANVEISDEEKKKILREELTRRAEKGWKIEIENVNDAVLSKKGSIAWVLHIFIILAFLVIFPVMSFIWLIVMIILAVTKKPVTLRIWVEKDGSISSR